MAKKRSLDPVSKARRLIADRVHAVMAYENVSMSTIAREAGMSPGQLSHFLIGRRNATFPVLARLFVRLGLEICVPTPPASEQAG